MLARVVSHLWTTYDLDVTPVPAATIGGSRAELHVAEGCIYYDERLEADPAQKLVVLVHELGHVVLHPRVHHRVAGTDPILGSAYLSDGAGAIARYSAKAREEAEANAFATEFLCPTADAFALWWADPALGARGVARRLSLPTSIVRAQLAEALFDLVTYGAVSGPTAEEPAERPARSAPDLDAPQRAAATYTGGPALINAGPGTGKTATLVGRIEFLLDERREGPEHLLVLTFSNDAAEELRGRVSSRFGPGMAERVEILTFHGLGLQFLRLHGHLRGVGPGAAILDEAAQQELMLDVLGRVPCGSLLDLRDPRSTADEAIRHIDYLKDRGIGVRATEEALSSWSREEDADCATPESLAAAGELLGLYRAYEAAKKARDAVDFGDLIALPTQILGEHPAIAAAYQAKYRWVMVDEYQDVGRAVATLLARLCGPGNPPWVVGDRRQAIYRFRGAAPENVRDFPSDFPGAQEFELEVNRRSCDPVVQAANQIATLMEAPQHEGAEYRRRWRSGYPGAALGSPALAVAAATSDPAEHQGIVAQVTEWRRSVPLRDIAVLARRNVDVRNIVLALGARGIPAAASGLATAEGAAGDLAAVLTLADAPSASAVRVTLALARGSLAPDGTACAVAAARSAVEASPERPIPEATPVGQIVADVVAAHALADAERHNSDAFEAIAAFLFDGSTYLRRLLEAPSGAERSLGLGEIVTTLSLAAGHRFTHGHLLCEESRVGFAEYLRGRLCRGMPSPAAPRPGVDDVDAVRVMTCHASKGLEFPCVIVAGQTLSQARAGYPWLPRPLRADAADDAAQADALLFVGVTRAKQALVVSYAQSKSGGTGGRERTVTPLLTRWAQHFAVPALRWDAAPAPVERVTIGPIWGGALTTALPIRALDERSCGIRLYLEHALKLRWPVPIPPLYPIFVGRVRQALQRVVARTAADGQRVVAAEAAAIFDDVWPAADPLLEEHPHLPIYRPRAADAVAAFARAFEPPAGGGQGLDVDLDISTLDGAPPLRLDLVAHYRAGDRIVAMVLHVGSLAKGLGKKGEGVLWSKFTPAYRRLPFVLLRRQHGMVSPQIFSVADGTLYPFQWSQRGTPWDAEADAAGAALAALARGEFSATISDYTCDRCPVRIACPHWAAGAADAAPDPLATTA